MAKVFLDENDNYKVINDGVTIFGASGDEHIIVESGADNVILDANVEDVDFAGNVSDFKFQQQGNQLLVFDSEGNKIAQTGVQQDGTSLAFADGTVQVVLNRDSHKMELGGTEILSDNPAAVTPENIDSDNTSQAGTGGGNSGGTGGETLTLAPSANSVDEGGVATFTIDDGEANHEYAYKVVETGAVSAVTTDAEGNATITVPASDNVPASGDTLTISIIGEDVSASVDVNPVNDAPALTDTAATLTDGTEDTAYTVSATDLLTGYTDEEGDALSVANLAADNGATVVDNGDDTYTITPAENFNGSVALSYDVTDGTNIVAATNTVNFAAVNDAPTTTNATNTADEAGDVITGQLEASDVDGDALTFTLDAPIEGLTLNADGSYTFDPKANTDAQALTYADSPLDIVGNYTVSDGNGATAQGSLTIDVTPTPLTFELQADKSTVEEGSTVAYKLVASEAVQEDFTGTIQIKLADGDTAELNDFGSGSFNPQTVTIAKGQTESNEVTITPTNDATTEMPETFTATATVTGYDVADVQTTVQDPSSVGGLGQTFNLTTGIDTIPGLLGSANSTGTDGNDTIVGTVDGAVSTFSALDNIDGGLGTDELKINDVATTAKGIDLSVATISNVETLTLQSVNDLDSDGAGAAIDTSNISGLTTLNATKSQAVNLKAADTTDVNVSGATGAITVEGGKDIVVNDATAAKAITVGDGAAGGDAVGTITITDTDNSGANAITVEGGTDVTVTATAAKAMAAGITVGDATNGTATGNVVITQNLTDNGSGADSSSQTITAVGGKTITITENLTSEAKAVTGYNGVLKAADISATADANTTTVTITQNESLKTVTKDAVAGTTETASVKFGALKAGDAITISVDKDATADATELTFTAAKDLTAAQVAAAFANLTNLDTQSATGITDNGIFTGALSLWTSGAADGDTVVFTSTTPDSNVTDLETVLTNTSGNSTAAVVTVTQGAAGTSSTTSGNSITMGSVAVDDNTTGTASVTTVTIDGYKGATIGGTNSMNALTTLSLANSSTPTGAKLKTAQTALDLTVNNVNSGVDLDNAAANKAITDLTLNAVTAKSAFALTAAALTNLTVDAAVALDLSTSAAANLGNATVESVTIKGAGSVNLGVALADDKTLNTFDASANTGGVTATVETDAGTLTGTISEYKFSAGADNVTLNATTGTTVDVNVSTLAGDDKVTLSSGVRGFATGKTLDAGEGTDTLSMDAADLTAVTGGNTFQDSISGFEKVTVGAIANTTDNSGALAETLDLANLDNISYVNVSGVSVNASGDSDGDTASLAISNLAANGTVNLTAAILNDTAGGTDTASLSIALADATGTADVLNLSMTDSTNSTGIINTGTVTANDIETININVSDKFVDANNDGIDDGTATHTLILSTDSAATINVSGASNLNFTDADTSITLIDASTMTGALTATASNDSETINGGSGADHLTATGSQDILNGDAGNDTLTGGDLTTLTGGDGADTFVMAVPTNVNSYSTITDFSSGDVIDLDAVDGGTVVFSAAGVTLAGTAVFQDYANAAVNSLGADGDDATWFQYDGNTYIVQSGDTTANNDFQNGVDSIIQITGLVDLGADASYNQTDGLLELA